MSNGDEELSEFLEVEEPIVVAIEEGEVFLVLFLFIDRDVFLYFFLGVVVFLVDGSESGYLFVGGHFWQVVRQADLLPFHQLQYYANLDRRDIPAIRSMQMIIMMILIDKDICLYLNNF